MSDTKDQEDINRAANARAVKENPVYQQAWVVLRATMFEKMEKLKAGDVEGLQEVKRTMDNLNRLEKVFNNYIDTGKMAEQKRSMLKFKRK